MPAVHFSIQVRAGAMLTLGIGVSRARREAMVLSNLRPAAPVGVSALVDTGASCTVVDLAVLEHFGLKPNDITDIITPSTGNVAYKAPRYDVSVWLIGGNNLPDDIMETSKSVIGLELAHQGFQVLLGRDVLEHCVLVYDGKVGRGSLSF